MCQGADVPDTGVRLRLPHLARPAVTGTPARAELTGPAAGARSSARVQAGRVLPLVVEEDKGGDDGAATEQARRTAAAEAERVEAARAEAERVEAARAEAARREEARVAEEARATEAARREAERVAAEEAARREEARVAEEARATEAARREAERVAAEEAARRVEDRRVALEATFGGLLRTETQVEQAPGSEELARAEARVAAEEAAAYDELEQTAGERVQNAWDRVEQIGADRLNEVDAAPVEQQEVDAPAGDEDVTTAAGSQLNTDEEAEFARLLEEETRATEARLAEEAARAEAERVAAEEAGRLEAERVAAEARAAEEAAARLAAEEAARAEAARAEAASGAKARFEALLERGRAVQVVGNPDRHTERDAVTQELAKVLRLNIPPEYSTNGKKRKALWTRMHATIAEQHPDLLESLPSFIRDYRNEESAAEAPQPAPVVAAPVVARPEPTATRTTAPAPAVEVTRSTVASAPTPTPAPASRTASVPPVTTRGAPRLDFRAINDKIRACPTRDGKVDERTFFANRREWLAELAAMMGQAFDVNSYQRDRAYRDEVHAAMKAALQRNNCRIPTFLQV